MCLPHLAEWASSQNLTPPRIIEAKGAVLAGFRLAWNYRSRRRAGAANVVREAGQIVHGVLLTTDASGLATIDRKEGTPIYYGRTLERVELANPSHRAGTPAPVSELDAWVYQVNEKWIEEAPIWPDRLYLDLLIAGARAHDLPPDYVSLLASLPVIEAA
jgi:hypothetical protein